jgi:hypothetical protein
MKSKLTSGSELDVEGERGVQEHHLSETKKFVQSMMDDDIASVFADLLPSLWNIATTFAIGAPPEQLVNRFYQRPFLCAC